GAAGTALGGPRSRAAGCCCALVADAAALARLQQPQSGVGPGPEHAGRPGLAGPLLFRGAGTSRSAPGIRDACSDALRAVGLPVREAYGDFLAQSAAPIPNGRAHGSPRGESQVLPQGARYEPRRRGGRDPLLAVYV